MITTDPTGPHQQNSPEPMTDESIAQIYARRAIGQIPRILGLCDRNPASATFGCFDRPYWHYRTVDFANGRLQEGALLLALLYKTPLESNPFYASEIVKEWSKRAIRFWAHSQERDGSLSEVYPREQSYVATAFSTLAISEAIQILDSDEDAGAVEKAAHWLSRNENLAVSNQVAGAIAALQSASRLTGIDRFKSAARIKLEQLLAQQSPEGWFPEYGGFDIGYNTICLSHLASYARMTDSQDALNAAERVGNFIDTRLREDGSYDPEPTSRKTQYVYPFGLAQIGRTDLLTQHARGVASDRVLQPGWMDDRFCIPLTLDYLQTYEVLHTCE